MKTTLKNMKTTMSMYVLVVTTVAVVAATCPRVEPLAAQCNYEGIFWGSEDSCTSCESDGGIVHTDTPSSNSTYTEVDNQSSVLNCVEKTGTRFYSEEEETTLCVGAQTTGVCGGAEGITLSVLIDSCIIE